MLRLEMGWRLALAILLGIAAVGLAIYAIRGGPADDPISAEMRPEVEGRLVVPIAGETATGSYEVKCEYDASVEIEGQTVVKVNDLGTAAKVEAGDKIVESMYEAPQPGADSSLEMGPLGQRQGNVSVYWGKDGRLHAGCAPESIKTRDGVSAPLGDRP